MRLSVAVCWAILIAAGAVLGGYLPHITSLCVIVALVLCFLLTRRTMLFAGWSISTFILTLIASAVLGVGLWFIFWIRIATSKAIPLTLFLGSALSYVVSCAGTKALRLSNRRWGYPIRITLIALVVMICLSATYLWGAGPDALSYAASDGQGFIVRLLLLCGNNVNGIGKYGGPPLVEAAMNGYTDVVNVLLAAGADVHKPNKDGVSALMQAAGRGNAEIVKTLLAVGADSNETTADGWTPLMQAAYLGKDDDNTEIVRMLLEAGANAKAISRRGETALKIAEQNQLQSIMELLKEAEGGH